MKSISRAAATLVAFAVASPCWAGQVKLEIHDGLVTLSAKDASVREVLAEWSRVGQTRIVNAERVPGGLLNLELNGVPEARALDTILRSAAGYMAAPRVVRVATGSVYDRIMVMPLPRPAAGGPSATAGAISSPPPQPFQQPARGNYQPQPSLMVDDQDEPVVQPQPQPMMPPNQPIGASQPGMATPLPQGAPGQYPYAYPQQGQGQGQVPGMAAPSPAAPRPGMTTTPRKPPGPPGGPGGN